MNRSKLLIWWLREHKYAMWAQTLFWNHHHAARVFAEMEYYNEGKRQ